MHQVFFLKALVVNRDVQRLRARVAGQIEDECRRIIVWGSERYGHVELVKPDEGGGESIVHQGWQLDAANCYGKRRRKRVGLRDDLAEGNLGACARLRASEAHAVDYQCFSGL